MQGKLPGEPMSASPQAPTAPGAPQPQAQGAQPGGGSAAEAAQKAFSGLKSLQMLAERQGAPEAQEFASLMQQFEALMNRLSGGGAPKPAAPPGAQPMGASSPEAGAARVRPAL